MPYLDKNWKNPPFDAYNCRYTFNLLELIKKDYDDTIYFVIWTYRYGANDEVISSESHYELYYSNLKGILNLKLLNEYVFDRDSHT